MPISGNSSQSINSTPSYESSQQLKNAAGPTYGLKSSNQENNNSSLFKRLFGSQTGQQNTNQSTNGGNKSGGMSWGEDIHYII